MNNTLNYYDTNANSFINDTISVDFSDIQNRFLELLPINPYILDFGCGSGRDTKYFLEKGCQVVAADGSKKLCKEASAYAGIEVKQMLFQELNYVDVFDGIWACASILHVPKSELLSIIRKMCNALKVNGVIYTSFKYGVFEGERNGRYFTDFTEVSFQQFISEISELAMEKYWITEDVRQGRGEEKWLNLILRKVGIH
ncbi:class I SAM-dependent methyltransferase [Faecalimonas sp.]